MRATSAILNTSWFRHACDDPVLQRAAHDVQHARTARASHDHRRRLGSSGRRLQRRGYRRCGKQRAEWSRSGHREDRLRDRRHPMLLHRHVGEEPDPRRMVVRVDVNPTVTSPVRTRRNLSRSSRPRRTTASASSSPTASAARRATLAGQHIDKPLCSSAPDDINNSIGINNNNVPAPGHGPLHHLPAGMAPSVECDKFAWSFGDGGTSTDNGPDHVYNSAGTYNVSLVLTGVWPPIPTPPRSRSAPLSRLRSRPLATVADAPRRWPTARMWLHRPVSSCTAVAGACNPGESVQFGLWPDSATTSVAAPPRSRGASVTARRQRPFAGASTAAGISTRRPPSRTAAARSHTAGRPVWQCSAECLQRSDAAERRHRSDRAPAARKSAPPVRARHRLPSGRLVPATTSSAARRIPTTGTSVTAPRHSTLRRRRIPSPGRDLHRQAARGERPLIDDHHRTLMWPSGGSWPAPCGTDGSGPKCLRHVLRRRLHRGNRATAPRKPTWLSL